MSKRIAISNLNGSTLDILNVIRANASLEYQNEVPVVKRSEDIPEVGEVIYGTPAFANQFIGALVNRIAAVKMQSAIFNNPYVSLKKGYIEYGETIEEIFVKIARVFEYDAEKAEARELKRYVPDVKTAFHAMNWRVIYPVTIQDQDLRLAFLSESGVTDLIANIVDQVYTAAEYDEFLLIKYMIIKAVANGRMYPLSIGDGADLKEAAVAFRANHEKLKFMNDKYNEAGVLTTTPDSRQVIFMDSEYVARYDVNVLASAFNMDKADFMGRLYTIDDWDTFDNERFAVIRENSDGLEEITAEELAVMSSVKAILIDSNWFQIYDNLSRFTEKYVASGLYWNYFYHTWKTFSRSPYANAIVFVESEEALVLPNTITFEITQKEIGDKSISLVIEPSRIIGGSGITNKNINFIQTQEATTAGIGVHPFGGFVMSKTKANVEFTPEFKIGDTTYRAGIKLSGAKDIGYSIAFNKVV